MHRRIRKQTRVVTGIIVLGSSLLAQQPQQKTEGARDLFYFGATKKSPLPPIQKTSAPAKGQSATAAPRTPASPPASVDSGVLHLGFRYTVALVNQTSAKAVAVDPDRVFHKGECVRLEVESNQSGYLYVLSKQSSGGWLPLFPSSEMPDENNVADPGQKVHAPHGYCFEIGDPPGTETLFVVLSRSPTDFFELYDAIKATAPAAPARVGSAPMQMASAGVVNSAVEKMAKNFGTRDLIIKKITPAADTQEKDYSVYVVNGSDKPSSTVVRKIELKHK